MCGLAGVVASSMRRSSTDIEYIGRLFTRLLVESKHRGPYATGAAMIRRDGSYRLAKEPMMASEFVETRQYQSVMESVNAETTILMGHTRYPTRGSHLDRSNNHPLVSDRPVPIGRGGRATTVLLTHNGHIRNADELFAATGYRRTARVDSEILLRFAESNAGPRGTDICGLIGDLTQCQGKLSAVMVSTSRPEQVIIVKGNMPLEVWYHPEMRLMTYASEHEILARSTTGITGWRSVLLPPWTVAAVNTRRMLPLGIYRFSPLPGGAACR